MNDTEKQVAWWQPAVVMFGKISGWVIIPILGALFLGRFLDTHFNTTPWLFILTNVIALTIAIVAVARICREYIQSLEEEEKDKKDESTNDTK